MDDAAARHISREGLAALAVIAAVRPQSTVNGAAGPRPARACPRGGF
jgi:hypothetical protein